jgi:chromosome partitioning protein
MASGPIANVEVAPTLGWPRDVTIDPRIGWPNVPRGTLTWPEEVVSFRVLDRDDSPGWSEIRATGEPVSVKTPAAAETAAPPSGQVPAAGSKAVQPALFRPPGPRRAHFDIDEFATAPEEPQPAPVPRGTSRGTQLLPAPAATRIFVVANQKGGVGKTTTTVNLAAALALGGLSVLVVDLDPQGNASTALGVDHPAGTPGTYEVIIDGVPMADYVVKSPEAPNLSVLPATIDLAGAEIELVSIVARENRLLRAVRGYLADHPTDYVFLDCPPSLGLLTLNALVAATEILIPIQCEYYALEGVSQLMRTINLVTAELNSQLRLTTVLLTMYDARTRLAAQVADEVRRHFAEQTLPTVIPRSVRVSEAPSYGQTVLTYHPDSAGSVSYIAAAQEIARRGVEETA